MTFCSLLADGKCRLWQRVKKENRGPQNYYSSVSKWHANNIIPQVWAKQAAKGSTDIFVLSCHPTCDGCASEWVIARSQAIMPGDTILVSMACGLFPINI
eukprot:scaffold165688_cov16-Prasinocladus_malaysianus.AAC.1